jgi:hypothetical protein
MIATMTEQHPIIPPQELVQQWVDLLSQGSMKAFTVASQWGADQQLKLDAEQIGKAYQAGADRELEACCEWLESNDYNVVPRELRAARRPKPPSLKEQALKILSQAEWSTEEEGIIRRALEQLDD